MSVVAVTRGGTGDLWLFDTEQEAEEHPLVQYGDVVCRGPQDVLQRWGLRDLPLVARLAGENCRRRFEAQAASLIEDRTSHGQQLRESIADQLWPALESAAKRPPALPSKICETVVRDRRMYMESCRMAKKNADAATTEPKVAKEKTAAGYPLTAKITLLAEKNPKRGAAGERFAKYQSGMTVDEAVSAGVTPIDISHDVKKGFISIAA